MLKVEVNHWNQRPEEIREITIMAEHPRTRERLLAIYEICEGKSATEVGKQTGRNPQTVMGWVHKYNQEEVEVLKYQHTEGHPPLCLSQSRKQ
jgi:transposase